MKKRLPLLAIALFVGVVVTLAYAAGLFSGLERFLEDRLFATKAIRSEIVIVAIDDASLTAIGQWPWPRAVFGEFIENVGSGNPAALGFDVMFSEPSRGGKEDDLLLAQALANADFPIILPVEMGDRELRPLPLFTEHTSLAHINVTVDPDGVVRTFPFERGDLRPLGYEAVRSGDIVIPSTDGLTDRTRIVFAGAPGSVRTIPFSRFLAEDLSETIKGKILLVGATALDLHDNKPTPVSEGTVMSGVEIHAHIANMLAQGYRLTEIPTWLSIVWILIAALIPLFTILRIRAFLHLLGINFGIGILYLIAQILLFEGGIVTPIIHIHLAWILSSISLISFQYFIVDREKAEMRKLFGKYVSPKVLDQILKNPGGVVLGGEERVITVLFSDIRGFTTLSEKTTPTELVQIINRYFSAMTAEILENDGVVDKYIGDAIMAFWGAPLPDDRQADKAVRAALGMKRKLDAFNHDLKQELGIEINIGVGLYTGPAVVGNMGSLARFDYTAMGDTVNTSSRLEGVTKAYGVNCIIGESTRAALREPHSYVIRELDQILVKGKKEPRKIFEPIDPETLSPVRRKQIGAFEAGREAYYRGAWPEAIAHLEEALNLGEDGPAQELLRRARELMQDPPPEWRGVYEFKTK